MILNKDRVPLLTIVIVLLMKQLVTKVLNSIDAHMACDHYMQRLRSWIFRRPILGLDRHKSL